MGEVDNSLNDKVYYENKLTNNPSEIPVQDSDAVWVQNANYSNNYTLWRKEYVLGKNWLNDKTRTYIYGWVEEVENGENKGMIEATVPTIPEDGSDGDCEILGYFDSIAIAMENIIKVNHPDYGIWI